MPVDLHRSAAVYAEMRERLITQFGLEEDEPTLLDTLSGETDLDDAIAIVLRAAQRAEADADAVEAIMDANKARKARHEARAERLRASVAQAMSDAGLKTVRAPDMTVSLRATKPRLLIDDATKLPPAYVVEITETKPNKDAIRDALVAGEAVPGARLTNGGVAITVRSA